jgi:multimeric flavodoxin WrbA
LKVALINGSPKSGKSTSRKILEAVLTQLEPYAETVWIDTAAGKLPDGVCQTLASCDAAVLAFPLYVDGIPAHLLRVMKDVETAGTDGGAAQNLREKTLMVYPIVNCGFMDEDYPEIAIEMVRLWCNRTGFAFGRAVGFCGGGMGPSLTIGKGPGTALGKALTKLTEDIRTGKSGEQTGRPTRSTTPSEDIRTRGSGDIILTKPTFPRFLYNISGNQGWKKAARNRGLKKKDLYRQP